MDRRLYRVAPFSIYVFFDLARRDAAARGDAGTAARLRTAYVDYTLSITGQMEALARDTFGREVPQVKWVLDLYGEATRRR